MANLKITLVKSLNGRLEKAHRYGGIPGPSEDRPDHDSAGQHPDPRQDRKIGYLLQVTEVE